MSYLNRENGYEPTGNVNASKGIGMGNVAFYFTDTLAQVETEFKRAVAKHGVHQTPADPDMRSEEAFIILSEEVGEVARALTYDEGSEENAVDELVQVAAMAIAMATGIRLRLKLRGV